LIIVFKPRERQPMTLHRAYQSHNAPPLILSLTGGGFRGYFTAQVLANIEQTIGAPCRAVFDLMAGTSIGGIIALGLAFGVRADTIAATMQSYGEQIFPPLRFRRARRFLGPPYSADGIEAALKALLPNHWKQPISEATQNVMVITASPGTARMEVFASWDTQRTGRISVRDAALATSAAPTYFPAHRVQLEATRIDLVDGGIAANAPDAVAIHHAVRDLAFPEERIGLLSIGTCAPAEGAASGESPSRHGNIGAIRELGGEGIVNLMMAIQERRGTEEAEARLTKQRYLRINRIPGPHQNRVLALDNASREAQLTLAELAADAHKEHLEKQHEPVWQAVNARAQAVRRNAAAKTR
jgi:predicted acylesterase/phospholipase RssA